MPVKREVKSRVTLPKKVEAEPVVPDEIVVAMDSGKEGESADQQVRKVARCQFCSGKIEPEYWNSSSLRRFISDRGRIQPRTRTGLCAKHQRRLTKQIKYSRHLALMPFLVRV